MKHTLKPAGAEPLVILTILDYAGIARGRGVPRHRFDAANGARTCGWVPANMSLTTFGIIADPNPRGSAGDLRLLPDARARYACWPARAPTPLDLVMSDIIELDGTPWMCCPRGFLKAALADFMSETGCEFIAAFEQEFQILGADWQAAPAFGVSALRRASPNSGMPRWIGRLQPFPLVSAGQCAYMSLIEFRPVGLAPRFLF